jgi:hypothetical protein
MKNCSLIIVIISVCLSCGVVDLSGLPIPNTNSTNNTPSLSNDEVIKGLKEALTVGIQNSVNVTGVTDGFLKNGEIRLPFPPDALKVKEKALSLGMQGQVDKFETTLNRAAEEAVKEALPIFKDAILNMSIQDGFGILKGGDGAATRFLKEKTTAGLTSAFLPKVKNATSKVQLTSYWNPIITKYNTVTALTGGEKINPDLDAYVTQLAIEGLFKMVEKEENKIRKDPGARVTDLLRKVFSSI